MASDFSRRQFLTAGTAFGATLGLAGLVGCAPKTAPQPQSGQTGTADQGAAATSAKAVSTSSRLIDVREQEVVATEECDIVVCGSGTAGTYAAVRAAELGARVIWLEKTGMKGGTSTIAEGTLAYNTTELMEAGMVTDLQAEFLGYMQWHNWGAYGPGIWCYLNNAGPAVDWAKTHGAKMYAGDYGSMYSCFSDEGAWIHNGEGMLQPLWAYGETLSTLDFRLNTPAVNIITEGGKVVGVYAKDERGIIRINAKAVVLATGGFGKNPEMCAERLRVPAERVTFLGFDGQDGDGINMALAAGAVSQAPSSVMYGLSKIKDESWSSMLSVFTQWPPSLRYPLETGKTLPMVNESGCRFYNETLADDCDTSRLNVALASQAKVFTLFDERHVQTYEGEDKMNEFVTFMGVGGGELRASIESNKNVYKADTIEELADKIGVDRSALADTVADYNARANGDGTPDPFGADASYMTPLETAPFYAAQAEACAYATVGGIRGDEDSRAVGVDGKPVAGLFVCGIDNGSLQYNDYPYGLHGGSGQGSCCATGFAAANAACKDLGLA